MKKSKVILSVLLMAAAISFTACSNASSGSSDPSTPAPATTPSTPSSGGSGGGSGSGSGSQTPAVTYIGSKAPSQAKEVGDIVFNDGSATHYTQGMSFTDAQKNAAIAIIFYTGTELNSDLENGNADTTTNRILGVGLKQNTTGLKWCDGAGASATYIVAIQCNYNESTGKFTGDKNGSDNLRQIGASITTDDTNTTGAADRYPAFYYAKNYSSTVTNLGIFNSDWYLPSIAELQQIYIKGKGNNKTFDIDAALQALGGDRFNTPLYWSSSQDETRAVSAYEFNFGVGSKFGENKDRTHAVCAIREFKTYGITIASSSNGTVTASKTSGIHPGETISLTASPATHYRASWNVTDEDGTSITVTNNSFIMPAKNINVSAIFTELPKYTVTYSDGVDNAEITVPLDTNQYYEGDEVTVKFTGIGERSSYIFAGWSNGTTTFTSNGTNKFTMGNSNVTLTAKWYMGTKTPDVAKAVGDIVFNDGSAMPYSDFASLSSSEQNDRKTSAIALIFYKGTGLNSDAADGTPDNTTSRTLGLGLTNTCYTRSNRMAWCKREVGEDSAANALSKKITTIICTVGGESGNYTFTGDKNGSNNLNQIASFLTNNSSSDDTTTGKYPAFDLAKDYKDEKLSTESESRIPADSEYANGWYLPSIAELYQIWQWKNGISSGLTDVLNTIDGKLPYDQDNYLYWSSSQNSEYATCAYAFNFKTGICITNHTKHLDGYICCIREFN